MADSGQEKTEEATPKKLREARRKGQVPKSKDVSTIMVLIFVFGVLALTLKWGAGQLQNLMKLAFSQASNTGNFQSGEILFVGKNSFVTFLKLILPFCTAAMIIAAFTGFLQVGAIFALDPLKPQMKKLNPLEGFKNMFKTQTFIELVKNIVKIFIVFYLAYSTLNSQIGVVLQTTALDPRDAAAITGDLITSFVIKVLIAFLVISVIDYLLQKQQFMKQMRMTKDEVKREYKQDEGDPHIKGHRKQLHREFAFSDAKAQVAQSDAVITNPVHVAVALKYDRQEMVAPEVMIRGQRNFAEMIKEVAVENNIPIIRNVPLAWALFELEDGEQIPEELYEGVAEILSYVYKMKQAKEKGQALPEAREFI